MNIVFSGSFKIYKFLTGSERGGREREGAEGNSPKNVCICE
jgi:hypothetical protein